VTPFPPHPASPARPTTRTTPAGRASARRASPVTAGAGRLGRPATSPVPAITVVPRAARLPFHVSLTLAVIVVASGAVVVSSSVVGSSHAQQAGSTSAVTVPANAPRSRSRAGPGGGSRSGSPGRSSRTVPVAGAGRVPGPAGVRWSGGVARRRPTGLVRARSRERGAGEGPGPVDGDAAPADDEHGLRGRWLAGQDPAGPGVEPGLAGEHEGPVADEGDGRVGDGVRGDVPGLVEVGQGQAEEAGLRVEDHDRATRQVQVRVVLGDVGGAGLAGEDPSGAGVAEHDPAVVEADEPGRCYPDGRVVAKLLVSVGLGPASE